MRWIDDPELAPPSGVSEVRTSAARHATDGSSPFFKKVIYVLEQGFSHLPSVDLAKMRNALQICQSSGAQLQERMQLRFKRSRIRFA